MHGPKWPFLLILIVYGPIVVVVNYWDRLCTLGRAPHTKETLPDFRKWHRVTRHPRVFRRLTGCQRTPGIWGVTITDCFSWFSLIRAKNHTLFIFLVSLLFKEFSDQI